MQAAGIKTARLDSLILLEYVTGKNRAWLLAHPNETVDQKQLTRLEQMLKKRIKRIPLAYVIGHKEFYGLNFKVTKDVLIPRPETEALVELAIKLAPKKGSLMDVGTGCGALAIAIAKNRPDLKITATDISHAALKMAKHNARLNLKSDQVVPKPMAKNHRIIYLQTDLLNNINKKFDLIVANLPYLPKTKYPQPEIIYEPHGALYGGGKDGLDIYRRFLTQVKEYLGPKGMLIIEAEPNQHQELINIAAATKLKFQQAKDFCLIFVNSLAK